MRNNKISALKEVEYLSNLKKLKILWLGENPVADCPIYRSAVIKMVPWIERLDNTMVSAEE
jgi:hypothetical protein